MSSDYASGGIPSESPDSAPPHQDLSRPNLKFAMAANWLSMVGSLMIMLHVPRVIEQVPTQKKRMLIIFCTAVSNFGFSFANILTVQWSQRHHLTPLLCRLKTVLVLQVFFQLLTCTLVIVSTFRLCGVFLFERRRSIPSKYIALCPLGAFILATVPAIAQQYGFDDCARYCWFVVKHYQITCQERSLWAYLCFYAWMILFLLILFGSTLYVMVRIAISFMHVRSRVKQVVNQTIKPTSGADPPPSPQPSAFERVRSLSYRVKDKTASIFSGDSRRQQGSSWSQQNGPGEPLANAAHAVSQHRGQQGIGSNNSPVPSTARSENNATFHGQNSSAPRNESILSTSCRDDDASSRVASNTASTRDPQTSAQNPSATENNIIRINERTLLVAILRQALYPISISVSGCIQIIVDLTVMTREDYLETLDYVANVATSIQGFLFFLVFMFDPAVVYTRRQWRKYMVWKYYIEFYYSLGMPQEGREFQDQFMQQCERTMIRSGSSKDEANYDVFLKQPSYSWSLQYDNLAMPSEFQTSYPLINVSIPADAESSQQQGEGPPHLSGSSSANVSPGSRPKKVSLSGVGDVGEKLPDKFYGYGHYGNGATRTDYTPSVSEPPTKQVSSPTHSCAEEEGRCHPMSHLAITSPLGNDGGDQRSQHVVFDQEVNNSEDQGAKDNDGQPRGTSKETEQLAKTSTVYEIHPNGYKTANRPTPPAHSHNHYQQGDGRELQLPRVDRRHHNHDVLGSDASACGSHSDAGSNYDYSSSDTDGEGGETDGTNGGRHRRHGRRRRASLVAANPGDVLAFPRLAKVATIGGSVGPPTLQRFRTSTNTATTGTTRPSKSSSAGRATFLSTADRSSSIRPSLKGRFKIPGMRGIRGIRRRDSVLDIGRYQTLFKYPRCAYLLHMVVRRLWIPREVRLPPISNPLRRASQSNAASVLEAHDSEAVLTVLEAMEMSQNEPYQECVRDMNGVGTTTLAQQEEDGDVGEGISLSRLRNERKLEERVIPMPPLADGDDYTAS
ncbi:hypothetical protein EC968_001454 [Mortierella alpina]|nr:hypothetical protein EC968_001454 [Mortierella alpina]